MTDKAPIVDLVFPLPVRVVITKPDGSTQVFDAVKIAVDGAIRQAQGKAKLTEKKEKKTRWEVPAVSEQELRAFTSGTYDKQGEDDVRKFHHATMIRLCAIRRHFFGLKEITFDTHDAILLSTMLKHGVSPSTLAKAVVIASKEDFWKNHGDIAMQALSKNYAALAGKYEAARTDPVRRLETLLLKLQEVDPFDATEIRAWLTTNTKNITAIEDRIASVRARLANEAKQLKGDNA